MSFDPEPNDRLPVLPVEDNLPRTPAQLPQALSDVLFDDMGNGTPGIDLAISPRQFSMLMFS